MIHQLKALSLHVLAVVDVVVVLVVVATNKVFLIQTY